MRKNVQDKFFQLTYIASINSADLGRCIAASGSSNMRRRRI
jgi:hypothetical protein